MGDYAPPLGDIKAAADPPPYPPEWDSRRRVVGYWSARRIGRFPTHTSGWYGVESEMAARHKRHADPMLYGEEPE